MINRVTDSPFAVWQQLTATASPGVYVVHVPLQQYWLPDAPMLDLAVVFNASADNLGVAIVAMSALDALLCEDFDNQASVNFFSSLVAATGAAVINPVSAQLLQPVFIPKPWGQEVWYTGIEARGVAGIADDSGVTPLPWLLAAFPELYGAVAPVLLKILDPFPDELLGDLYFELHQEKREVYVVTAIDPKAWPDGKGAIRFGFDQSVRQQYDNDHAFVAAYFKAVRDYEVLRRQIDEQLDQLRVAVHLLPTDPVSPETMRDWLTQIDPVLIAQEQSARDVMNRFTHLKPLELGDIVKVPTLLPHSLQHGVRTVEFQTPVYERMILSFAQKVLTQSHWDTEQALPLMNIDAPEVIEPVCLARGEGWQCEQVVDFADFAVERYRLEAGAAMQFAAESFYRLVMMVSGKLSLGELTLCGEQASLLPAGFPALDLFNNTSDPWIFLLAKPKLSITDAIVG